MEVLLTFLASLLLYGFAVVPDHGNSDSVTAAVSEDLSGQLYFQSTALPRLLKIARDDSDHLSVVYDAAVDANNELSQVLGYISLAGGSFHWVAFESCEHPYYDYYCMDLLRFFVVPGHQYAVTSSMQLNSFTVNQTDIWIIDKVSKIAVSPVLTFCYTENPRKAVPCP